MYDKQVFAKVRRLLFPLIICGKFPEANSAFFLNWFIALSFPGKVSWKKQLIHVDRADLYSSSFFFFGDKQSFHCLLENTIECTD